jgi:hypothetical protein
MRSPSGQLQVIIVLVFVLATAGCLPATTPAGPASSTRPQVVLPATMRPATSPASFGSLPLYFVENQGQADARVGYYVGQAGGTS